MGAAMRVVAFDSVVERVRVLCQEATCVLPVDVLQKLRDGLDKETLPHAKNIMQQYLDNAAIASTEKVPLCQDTGVAVFFVEIGQNVRLDKGTLYEAINEGTRRGYSDFYLRKSIARDPLFNRANTGDNTPAVIHVTLTEDDKFSITFAPKGGGSENMSAMKMLKVHEGINGVVQFVYDTVMNSGGNACPPLVVGVGVGGNFEMAPLLAKKALLRKVGSEHPNSQYNELEKQILAKLNGSGLGPQGLGGANTALAVHIEAHPCHIASLPVAVNLNCNSARHASIEL
jgi:fumarate hydratase subunit alpha